MWDISPSHLETVDHTDLSENERLCDPQSRTCKLSVTVREKSDPEMSYEMTCVNDG
uniref:Uncharacterized protein n=1 Tax=Anguilla anguilla TaxID=7936 RepID=A0A0E9VM24_ANGAN